MSKNLKMDPKRQGKVREFKKKAGKFIIIPPSLENFPCRKCEKIIQKMADFDFKKCQGIMYQSIRFVKFKGKSLVMGFFRAVLQFFPLLPLALGMVCSCFLEILKFEGVFYNALEV